MHGARLIIDTAVGDCWNKAVHVPTTLITVVGKSHLVKPHFLQNRWLDKRGQTALRRMVSVPAWIRTTNQSEGERLASRTTSNNGRSCGLYRRRALYRQRQQRLLAAIPAPVTVAMQIGIAETATLVGLGIRLHIHATMTMGLPFLRVLSMACAIPHALCSCVPDTYRPWNLCSHRRSSPEPGLWWRSCSREMVRYYRNTFRKSTQWWDHFF